MSVVLKVENVSKQYRLGLVGSKTLQTDVQRWWYKVRGKEDPLLKIGESNDRAKKGESSYVWALKDINFDVEQGEVLGVLGRNGSGKSTLLKVLSKVTAPTLGEVKVKGRISSLLEVGTGFHPELTGKENIYLNGAILGMRRHEITRKLDEIVDFAGVERYLDTPVKRYSSGMYVRLAFAVAAHLESEILIVDEVLAVGDAEFQKKCMGKMGEVSKGDGRTILFVSHNMASVKSLCKKSLLLENGILKYSGPTDDVIKRHLGSDREEMNHRMLKQDFNGFYVEDAAMYNPELGISAPIYRDKPIHFKVNFNNKANLPDLYFTVKLKDEEGKYFLVTSSVDYNNLAGNGPGSATMHVPPGFFNEGNYAVEWMVSQKHGSKSKVLLHEYDLLHIQILPESSTLGIWKGKEVGFIRHTFEWTT